MLSSGGYGRTVNPFPCAHSTNRLSSSRRWGRGVTFHSPHSFLSPHSSIVLGLVHPHAEPLSVHPHAWSSLSQLWSIHPRAYSEPLSSPSSRGQGSSLHSFWMVVVCSSSRRAVVVHLHAGMATSFLLTHRNSALAFFTQGAGEIVVVPQVFQV